MTRRTKILTYATMGIISLGLIFSGVALRFRAVAFADTGSTTPPTNFFNRSAPWILIAFGVMIFLLLLAIFILGRHSKRSAKITPSQAGKILNTHGKTLREKSKKNKRKTPK